MTGIPLYLLLIYSCFSINLVLQCGLGIKGVVESKNPFDMPVFIKSIIVFISIICMWFFFSMVVSSFFSGLIIYVLLFPVSAVFYSGLEYLIFNFLLKNDRNNEPEPGFPPVFTAAASFICVNIAGSILDTVILSFGFIAGLFLINFIIWEIRRRAALEAVPLFLRGKPLILIAMGLLSLIFTSASLLLFRMIDAG